MARYLAIFSDIHHDEFEVNGFKIMTDKEQARFEELATSITWDFEYLANSETLQYPNGEDFLSRMEFKEITKAEYDLLEKIFDGQFGTFITEKDLVTIISGTDDDYE